jgi:hypothetical protein
MQQIQCLAFAQIFVDVDEIDLTDDFTRLQSKPGTGTDQTTTADNADFHLVLPLKIAVKQSE